MLLKSIPSFSAVKFSPDVENFYISKLTVYFYQHLFIPILQRDALV